MLSSLSSHGVLGLNARNLLYIKPFNPRKAFALADDKLKTKAFLAARGVPTAKMYARIQDHAQLRSFDFSQLPDSCVLKPNYGFGGEGIMVLQGRKNGVFIDHKKRPVPELALREHMEDILDGKYSIKGLPDTAFFERLLLPSNVFAPFRPAGLPDIRIVVFNLVPVMAMVRIPTAMSEGKANTHLGGIGIGIDIARGVTTHATQFNKRIRELPHGGSPSGIQIPDWEEMLLIASRIQYITNIGYLAVDLTIDQELGPQLLEVNARAGLMVQVANLAPLRSRLERVGGVSVQTPEKGVRLAQDLFGSKKATKKSSTAEYDRPVLGTRETITVSGAGVTAEVPVRISHDQERSLFTPDLLDELLAAGAAELENKDEGLFRVKFSLGGKKLQTVVSRAEVSPASVRAVIGRRDLAGFFIDPAKIAESPAIQSRVKDDVRVLDKMLAQADQDLLLLKHVKPQNLTDEWANAMEDVSYNPVFQYEKPQVDLDDLEAKLEELTIDDSPIGLLFGKKRRELLQRIALIRARGDARKVTEASLVLFGSPTSELLTAARSRLEKREACEVLTSTEDDISAEEAAITFRDVLDRYGLANWQVNVREHTVARCTVGGQKITLRKDAVFSRKYLPALIAHEIETHVITAENGVHQPYELFRRGFANYLDTQEGIAIYNQNRFLSEHHEKRYGPARSMLAAAYAIEHSFAETRKYAEEKLGYSPAKALSKAIDVKRGMGRTEEKGGFTKGMVYFRGLRAVEQYVADGHDLTRLYIGKIALEDLELLEKMPDLKAPIIVPEFLRTTSKSSTTKKATKKKGRL